jgi:hypothetical protein
MRFLVAATTLVLALLCGASVGVAADIGANDDSAKYAADGGAAMYGQMSEMGLRQTVIGVRFVPREPMIVQDKLALDRAIASAEETGIRVVLAVYPFPARELEAGLGSSEQFAAYVGVLASIYPQVKQFVIGNEPNQNLFWRPQFAPSGQNASAASFGPYLAAAYDALKGVDPGIEVVGVGLSPRGNDRPDAKNNVSTSPVRFLRALGSWYRRSGRTRPLMDAFSFHPYPRNATDPLERGYQWPNAGFVNLDRIKQALWDAFHGTPQPTTLDGLKLHLDEVGWQVDTTGRPGYVGPENVPVTDELTQAAIYGQLVRAAACDPDIAELSFFGFRDDGLRKGFQAGLERVDGTPRAAAAAVSAAIADAERGCAGPMARWQPGLSVIGARVAIGARQSAVKTYITAGEDARAKVCVRSSELAGGRCRTAKVTGLRPVSLSVDVTAAVKARVKVSIELAAESNRARKTRVVKEATLRR